MPDNKKVFLWNEDVGKTTISECTHIRVYHACRTENIESYIKYGIHTFDREQAYRMVYYTLRKCGIGKKEIVECFNKRWDCDIHHFNTICVSVSQEELLNLSGHYLVYGSEFICGMAADLFCQNRLKQIGIPTLFECHIDKAKFSQDDLQLIENSKILNGYWDGGIYLRDDIFPEEIVGYNHPLMIYDSILGCHY